MWDSSNKNGKEVHCPHFPSDQTPDTQLLSSTGTASLTLNIATFLHLQSVTQNRPFPVSLQQFYVSKINPRQIFKHTWGYPTSRILVVSHLSYWGRGSLPLFSLQISF